MLITRLRFRIERNRQNGLHVIDGGIVKTGRFNRYGFDRTLWHAFTDFGRSILPQGQTEAPGRADGNDRERKKETPCGANGAVPQGKPIPRNDPDNISDNDPDHHTGNESARTGGRFAPPAREEAASYCRERNNGVDAWRFVDCYAANGTIRRTGSCR